MKPPTAHIVCMKAVPGSVEESVEFTDSALIGEDTSWVEEAFSPFSKTITSPYCFFFVVHTCTNDVGLWPCVIS